MWRDARHTSLAIRMATVRAVLMRGLDAKEAGKLWRQVGQVFFPVPTHFWKHLRQKLCWQGACKTGDGWAFRVVVSFVYRDWPLAEVAAECALQRLVKDAARTALAELGGICNNKSR